MLKVSKRVIVSSLVFAGFVGLIAVLTFLLSLDINRRINKLEEGKLQEDSIRSQITRLSILKRDSEKARLVAPTLEQSLPRRDDLVGLPRELEIIAEKYNLGYGFSFGNELVASENSPGLIRYQISLSGSPENLLSFLQELDKHPFYITMTSINYLDVLEGDYQFTASGEIFIR